MLADNSYPSESIDVQKTPSVLRKVIRYLQNQALDHSSAKQYLTPPGKEPQHRGQHRQYRPFDLHREGFNLLTASTAAGDDRQDRSASNGVHSQVDMATSSSPFAHDIKRVQYAQENLLQSYEVFIPDHSSKRAADDKYWILYIHGGYFRDPKVDATSFRPALDLLAEPAPSIAEETESESQHTATSGDDFFAVQHKIAGFASINYRLAPHVAYPQDPETTPRYELREAQWPDQIDDILASLRHLQTKYNFGTQYILSGHSVGAELAYLAALKLPEAGLPSPKCVIGCNGIYDFPQIHKTNPTYEGMTRNAMKPEFYTEASPALYALKDYVRLADQGTTRFLLSHSREDELVVWEQVEIMKKTLDEVSAATNGKIKIELMETGGSHNALWSEGKPLALVIKEGLNMTMT